MRLITSPLRYDNQGSDVANLQAGLRLLLNRQMIQISDGERQSLEAALAYETQQQVYGDATAGLITIFQRQFQLPVTGEVDHATAERLNQILSQLGALEPDRFVVRGVVRQSNGDSFEGIVRAFTRDINTGNETALVQTISNADGYYEIIYTADQFRHSPSEVGGPNLIVRAYNYQGQILATSPLKINAEQEETIDLTITVWEQPTPTEEALIVKGSIRLADDSPFAGVEVQAFDKDLRRLERLGQTTTNQTGDYEITYTRSQFSRVEKQSADLVIKVIGPISESTPRRTLATSPTLFNAPPVAVIDLTISADIVSIPSEYERFLAELYPLLGQISLGELREDDEDNPEAEKFQDITFLARETGINFDYLVFLNTAFQFSNSTNLDPAFFYGLFRQNLPADLPALLVLNAVAQRRALEMSFDDNIIPAWLRSQLDQALDRLRQLLIEQTLEQPEDPQKVTLGALLNTSPILLSRELQTIFLITYLQHEGSDETFWEALQQRQEFQQPGLIADLQFTLQLGLLTQNHLPLVQELQQLRQQGFLQSPKDLVKLNVENWQELITRQTNTGIVGVPADITGETNEEKVRNYAQRLTDTVEAVFPTATIAHKLELQQGGFPPTELILFFRRNPTFEFSNTHVDTYLQEHAETALAGLDNPDGVAEQLRGMQRVFNLTPRHTEMQVLLSNGLHSAQSIASFGKDVFVQQYGDRLGGASKAEVIYAKAEHTAAMATAILAKYATGFNELRTAVTPGPLTNADDLPNWASLFGSLDFCACEHCRSVYSPAAYLVDLLEFLKKQSHPVDDKTAKDVLLAHSRRSDIGHLELSCENTNTVLPYIDLVNEILENAIAPRATSAPPLQTRGTTEELSINPEYVNEEAYKILAKETTVYPWNLPSDRWLEEARIYLEKLGIRRHELMEAFQKPAIPPNPPSSTGTPASPTNEAIALEYLGLTPVEQKIITNVSSAPLWQLWGYESNPSTGLLTNLAKVRVFLQKSNLSYQELSELLETRFINPDRTVPTLKIQPETTCEIDKMEFTGLTEALLNRIHRFVRLHRKLDWTMVDLDKTITALKSGELTNSFLSHLSHIQKIKKVLNLPLERVLTLWGTIDRDGKNSLYNKLFLNKAVFNPVDSSFDLSRSTSPRPKLSEHKPPVLAALRINEADFDRLRTAIPVSDEITLENLSALYRYTVLARALKLPIEDFLSLRILLNINPFDTAHPEDTLLFIEQVHNIRASGFSVSELNYLYRHLPEPSPVAPSLETIVNLVKTLLNGLNKIISDTAPVPNPDLDLLQRHLTTLLDSNKATVAIAFLNSVSADTPDNRTFINLHFGLFLPTPDYTKLVTNTSLSDEQRTAFRSQATEYVLNNLLVYLRDSLSRTLVKQTLSEQLQLDKTITELLLEKLLKSQADSRISAIADFLSITSAGLAANYFKTPDLTGSPAKRIDPILDFNWGQGSPAPTIPAKTFSVRWEGKLLAQHNETYTFYIRTNNGIRLWIDGRELLKKPDFDPWSNRTLTELSDTIAFNAGQLYDLKLEYTNSSPNALIQLSWSSSSTPKAIVPQSNFYTNNIYTHLHQTYLRLHKSALLINRFKLTAREIDYLSNHGTDFAEFNLNQLPLSTTAFKPSFYQQWQRLNDFVRLRDSLSGAETSLLDVFAATSLAEAQTTLALATGWDRQAIEYLTNQFNFTANNFKNEISLLKLQHCLNWSQRLDVPTKQLFDWSQQTPDFDQVQAIKGALKAKYDNDVWIAISKPLQNTLREKRRDVLVSYLLAHPSLIGKTNLDDVNDLYAYFLIDPEMSACQMTSRIKQAISSVQLFVQRCLLGLEKQVSLRQEASQQWKWMKNHPVWVPGRQVWLYPENLIEPELRDGKSPFFKDLEGELLQNEVTSDTVETAFRSYLEKLDGVARLEICGMYAQIEEGTNILHVFGRTIGADPRFYYYRRWVDSAYWTPWERIDVDIQGDHLIPVVYERRLRLFWAIFTEQAQTESPNAKYWEIQLAWSEYKNGKWSTKQVLPKSLTSRISSKLEYLQKEDFTFSAQVYDNSLTIWCFENKILGGGGEFGKQGFGLFKFIGCYGEIVAEGINYDLSHIAVVEKLFNLLLPTSATGSDHSNMWIEEKGNKNNRLSFKGYTSPLLRSYPTKEPPYEKSYEYTLGVTPGTFRLLFPHQYSPFELFIDSLLDKINKAQPNLMPPRQAFTPFFYQDQGRTFFVTSKIVEVSPTKTLKPNLDLGRFQQNRSFLRGDEILALTPSGLANGSTIAPIGIANSEIVSSHGSISMVGSRQPAQIPNYLLRYLFETFYHPYVCTFIKELNRHGIEGLLNPNKDLMKPAAQQLRRQRIQQEYFNNTYKPSDVVSVPYPKDDIDFSYNGAYSLYNWELFFHAPLLIADRLMKNQRFEEAQKWFHYIFDPTIGFDPNPNSEESKLERFWKIKPFYDNPNAKQQLKGLLSLLDYKGTDPKRLDEKQALEMQINQWRQNPFNPHLIARLRISAYQKTVVMKYIDNLIAWADQLFRQDTIESINEATQLYILAAEILGPRPQSIKPKQTVAPKSYTQLERDLDAISRTVVQVENLLPPSDTVTIPSPSGTPKLTLPPLLYFCIPKNDKLLGYWDTVGDRLFKIRHCMNIEGVVRELPLFEPPIDPALLVQAVAKGLDLSRVLNDINTPTPHYRFTYMLQKALELCNDLKSLGAALLSALEKKDTEELAAIRANQETALLNLITEIKKKQKEEATIAREGLVKTHRVTEVRYRYYQELLDLKPHSLTPGSRQEIPVVEGANGSKQATEQENENLRRSRLAQDRQENAASFELLASIAHAIPNISKGIGVAVSFGGSFLGAVTNSFAKRANHWAGQHTYEATRAATLASKDRRRQEWILQNNVVAKELEQIDKQIAAADIRIAISENELKNHEKQIENAQQITTFLRSKYTNEELYSWMTREVSTIYFQCYQMAYDLAKKTEKAYRFERGLTTSNFIQFGYWDSLRKGLLAGDRLYLALKQMERAYLDQNKREYEISKNISLVLHDPLALIALKETGQCIVELPETLFDADYPGHYMRRIKSVSLTIPCVTGPYTSVNCTLTLLANKTRIKSVPTKPYQEDLENDDDRFVTNFAAMQSIATSTAQNDSGMFELSFRDERYLPFEGAGAVSRWRIDMPQDCNAFDFNTISDVIIRLNYTAREGGAILKDEAKKALKQEIENVTNSRLVRLFSLKHEFPADWHRFLRPTAPAANQPVAHSMNIRLDQERFPFHLRGQKLFLNSAVLFLKVKEDFSYSTPKLKIYLNNDAGNEFTLDGSPVTGLPYAKPKIAPSSIPTSLALNIREGDLPTSTDSSSTWWQRLEINGVNRSRLKPEAIEDIWIIFYYSIAGS
ncbi:peptidoglycan-binding protein [Cyanobacteria bacterium FACHB-DQ100]|nr:peptidoglycan-binding protein [Cyanobacteria bacterium FACHB-DQ100]